MHNFFQLSIRLSLLLVLLLLLQPFKGIAQGANANTPATTTATVTAENTATIRGRLTDPAGQPLPFANVVFLKAGVLQTGVISGNDGIFRLTLTQTCTYTLRIIAIGYIDYTIQELYPG